MTADSPRLTPTLIVCAIAIEAGLLLVLAAETPAQQVAYVLVGYLVAGAAFGGLLWRLRRDTRATCSPAEMAIVIGAAVVFRATLFGVAPATSHDVYRYLWEGLVQQRGFDPYRLAPDSPPLRALAAEHEALWERINHRDIPAIYPPTMQTLFRIQAAALGGTLLGWKCVLLLFDGLLAGVLALKLRRLRAPPVWLAGVLWCPLLLLECYEGGHLDLVGVALLAAAVVAYEYAPAQPRGAIRGTKTLAVCLLSGMLLGLSIDVKYFWPAVVAVLLTLRTRPRRYGAALAAAALLVAAAAWVPYRAGFVAARDTARMFAEHWTFNDIIFEALRMVPMARWGPMVIVMVALAAAAGLLGFRRRAAGVAVAAASDGADAWTDVWLLSGTTLLLAPVAYPWYFLWIVPGLVCRPPLWLVTWVLAVPALHLVDLHYVRTGVWDPMPWLWWVVDVLPALLLAGAWRRRLCRR